MLPALILYLDRDYQVTYWIIRDDVILFSQVTIPQAIQLLKNFEFDLIISDPQNIAILKPSATDPLFIEGKNKDASPARPLSSSPGTS
jgi:hypothetical protein